MTYELAKQLKDAGFPQDMHDMFDRWATWGGELNDHGKPLIRLWDRFMRQPDDVFMPTLSELIAACGDNFQHLWKDVYQTNDWSSMAMGNDMNEKYGHGKTPEEAVARLWLNLNANKR